MNEIFLTGIVGREPACSVTKSGTSIAKFSLAVKRERDKERTDWFNIVTFQGVENFIKPFIHKGDKIAVRGSFQFEDYEKDGDKKTSTSVIAGKIEILKSINQGEKIEQQTMDTEVAEAQDTGNSEDDRLPF